MEIGILLSLGFVWTWGYSQAFLFADFLLQNYLKGEIDLDDLYEVDSECDSFKPPSDWGIKEKSEQFKKFYAERQSQFDSSIQEYQKMITTKRAEYQRLAVEVQKAGAA